MAFEIVMPRLSDSMEEGTILQWFVAEGDDISEGQPLVEVETDKASVTYEAEQDGTVLTLNARAGESVAVGAVIAVVGADGEGRGAGSPAGPESGPAMRTARVKASPLARRIAAEQGVDLAMLAGSGPQGRVIRSDVERSARAGDAAASESPTEPAATVPELRAVPDARPARSHEAPGELAPAGSPPATSAAGVKGEVAHHGLSHVQRTVARRMAQSRATVPDFELRCSVDMSRAVALREQLREISDRPPSYNDLLVKAVATALREFPRVNGSYRDEMFDEYSRVNVGIAVAAPDALVVPTIFDADRLSLSEIASVSRALAAKVRDGTISPAELGGSTFSISNLGMYGVDSFSAVINPPQAAILAVGSLRRRPVVDESSGAVVARDTVELTLACDHRILYGADAARFLARVRELLERPLAMLV